METRTHAEKVAAEVRASLARSGMPQSDLAQATGMSNASLSRKLKGRQPFYLDELMMIAPILGTSASALVAAAERVGTEQVSA